MLSRNYSSRDMGTPLSLPLKARGSMVDSIFLEHQVSIFDMGSSIAFSAIL